MNSYNYRLSRRKAPIIIGLRSSIPFSSRSFLPLPFILSSVSLSPLPSLSLPCYPLLPPYPVLPPPSSLPPFLPPFPSLSPSHSYSRPSLFLLSPHFPSPAIPSSLPTLSSLLLPPFLPSFLPFPPSRPRIHTLVRLSFSSPLTFPPLLSPPPSLPCPPSSFLPSSLPSSLSLPLGLIVAFVSPRASPCGMPLPSDRCLRPITGPRLMPSPLAYNHLV